MAQRKEIKVSQGQKKQQEQKVGWGIQISFPSFYGKQDSPSYGRCSIHTVDMPSCCTGWGCLHTKDNNSLSGFVKLVNLPMSYHSADHFRVESYYCTLLQVQMTVQSMGYCHSLWVTTLMFSRGGTSSHPINNNKCTASKELLMRKNSVSWC